MGVIKGYGDTEKKWLIHSRIELPWKLIHIQYIITKCYQINELWLNLSMKQTRKSKFWHIKK